MSAISSIEWTDKTWNPVRGCSIVSPGCHSCYAMKQAHRFSGAGRAYEGLTKQTKAGPQWTGVVRTVESALHEPLSWRKPARVFVDSMSDLFHEDVPFEFIAAVFAVMAYCERHTFQVLTKRPERMLAFMAWVNAPEGADVFTEMYGEHVGQSITMPRMRRVDEDLANGVYGDTADGLDLSACLYNGGVWPPKNVWLGVSVENQQYADERIPLLLQTPAAVRFISAEPLLGPVDLTNLIGEDMAPDLPGLDWVIVGGESGHGARPFDVSWARGIVQQCQAAGVPAFVKQLGKWPSSLQPEPGWMPLYDSHDFAQETPMSWAPHSGGSGKHGDPSQWPDDLRVREWPAVSA